MDNEEYIKGKYRYGKIEALYFNTLPQRAKEIFFEYLTSPQFENGRDRGLVADIVPFDYSFCESPIEVIFNFAYDLMGIDRKDVPIMDLEPQYYIVANGKNYRADFIFDTDYTFSEEYSFENHYKLVIECDGHNFHEKTKEQVKHNNERDYDLKTEGYDILHFSGSQIYNEPFECANKTIDYILSKIGKWERK